MTEAADLRNRTVAVLQAPLGPGPQLVRRLADGGARVIAMGQGEYALRTLARHEPDLIETLVIEPEDRQRLRLLRKAWRDEPLHAVVNLLPLDPEVGIDGQITALTALMRSMGRGLAAGSGALISIMAEPADPLALHARALCAAVEEAGTGLAAALSRHGVRVHNLRAPEDRADRVLPMALLLCGKAGCTIASGTIRISDGPFATQQSDESPPAEMTAASA